MRPAPPAVRRSTRLAGVVAAAALVLVSTPRARRPRTPGPCRAGRPSRSAGTATATATACRSTARRAPPARGWATGRSSTSTTRAPRGARARGRVRVLITADTSDDLVVEARPGLTLRDTAASGSTALPDNGATRWRVTPRVGRRQPRRLPDRRRWHDFAHAARRGRVLRRRRPDHAGHAVGHPRLPRPAAGGRAARRVGRARHRQHRCARELPHAASCRSRCRRCGAPPRCARRSSRRAPTRRTSGPTRAPSTYQICDTHLLPGVRRLRRRAPGRRRRDRRHPPRGPDLAGAHPAFTQFSSSSGGWTSAGCVLLPAGAQRPVRRVVGQPGPLLVDGRHRHPPRERVAGRRQPHAGSRPPATATATGAAGSARVTLSGSRGRVQVSGDTFRAVLGLRSTWMTFRATTR